MKELFAKIRWLPEDAPFAMRSDEVPIDRGYLGYGKDEFPYDNGAILCGFGKSACKEKADMSACIPLPKDGGPTQVRLSAARIGDLPSDGNGDAKSLTGAEFEVVAN